MAAKPAGQAPAFDMISQPARQRIRARIADAGGNIDVVANEIRAQLDAHDAAGQDGMTSPDQAQRAFYVAQLSYLDYLKQQAEPDEPAQPSGFFARLKGAFGSSRASQ